MPGGLLQIIAYGIQDIYLTNNPQVTFFKTSYRRHTNFSMEVFAHTLLDNPNFGKKNSIILPRSGDLLHRLYLRITINSVTPTVGSNFAWIRRLGHAIIQQVEINIGGYTIDKHYGSWLDIWFELSRGGNHDKGYLKLIGDRPELTKYDGNPKPSFELFIPLQFWFNRYHGLSLPMIAIRYHFVQITFTFASINNLIIKNDSFGDDQIANITMTDVSLLSEYIYLEDKERERFANVGHEYLIELVQSTETVDIITEKKRFQILFNHPTKELIWYFKNGNYISGKKFLWYTHQNNWNKELINCAKNIIQNSTLLLNAPVFGTDNFGNEIIITEGEQPPINGEWEPFNPRDIDSKTIQGNFTVTNNSNDQTLWINTSSLIYENLNYMSKINANINVTINNTVMISNLTTSLTIRDISIPVELITDTRVTSDDPSVNQFSNYGVYINGDRNPITYSQLEFNDQVRVEKREGRFFNYLQPWMHHSKGPTDGVNMYSFSLEPELLQPTGTSNFSRIENIILTIWVNDYTEDINNPPLNLINEDSFFTVYSLAYNIIRVYNGLVGLAYTN